MSQYIDEDDVMAMRLWNSCGGVPWHPPAWHESPGELTETAKALNEMGRARAEAAAGKHSNPPCQPTRTRTL